MKSIKTAGRISLFLSILVSGAAIAQTSNNYDDLLTLFGDWREFERPPQRDGAPD